MKNIIFFIFIIFLGCNSEKNQIVLVDESCEYFIPLSAKEEIDVNSLFEEYKYIPLETRDDALLRGIDEIQKIIVNERGIYIADIDKLIVWNMDGECISILSQKGEDPQSYRFLSDFMVWPNGNISIADGNAIVSYTKTNEFIYKKRYDDLNLIKNITYLDDSLLVVENFDFRLDFPRFIIINNHSREIIHSYDTIKKLNNYLCFYANSYNRYKGHILSNDYQRNEILELTKDSLRVWCKINVDNRTPPDGFWSQDGKTDMQVILEEQEKGYIGHIPNYLEGDSTNLLSFKGKRDDLEGFALVNKNTRKAKLLKNIKFDNNFRWLPSLFFAQENSWCAMLIYPEDILKKEEFAQCFPGLSEDSNPVLFWGKLK